VYDHGATFRCGDPRLTAPVNVKDFGAKGYETLDTKAIQDAPDACGKGASFSSKAGVTSSARCFKSDLTWLESAELWKHIAG
jgi:hypothetical protein